MQERCCHLFPTQIRWSCSIRSDQTARSDKTAISDKSVRTNDDDSDLGIVVMTTNGTMLNFILSFESINSIKRGVGRLFQRPNPVSFLVVTEPKVYPAFLRFPASL